jgi:hypothetical protein
MEFISKRGIGPSWPEDGMRKWEVIVSRALRVISCLGGGWWFHEFSGDGHHEAVGNDFADP